MITKVQNSLKKINYKLLISLFVIGLVPTLYTTLRVFFLGQLPGEYSFSIAGQLSWVNLLYEILNEATILPLFFFVGKVVANKRELANRVNTGIIVTFGIYFVLALLVVLFIKPLLVLMAVNKNIIQESAEYICLESVALIFSVLANFVLVVIVALEKDRYVYILTGAKLALCIIFDTFMISMFSFSLNLGVNGIAISNIIVNALIFVISLVLLKKENVCIFKKQKLSFSWMKELLKVGGISALESFVRNIAYMIMIVRMVNVVNEQGTYWVANGFIWGWLLLPVTQLGEYIKKDVATDADAVKNKTFGYFMITAVICSLWFASIPLWKPFMAKILLFKDVDKLYNLVMILVGFYVLYAFQNVFDSTFYGLGKTNYMLFESVITNCIYYGTAFVLYLTKVWVPTLMGITLLFGFGVAFDSLVSLGVYIFVLKKNKINIFDVET